MQVKELHTWDVDYAAARRLPGGAGRAGGAPAPARGRAPGGRRGPGLQPWARALLRGRGGAHLPADGTGRGRHRRRRADRALHPGPAELPRGAGRHRGGAQAAAPAGRLPLRRPGLRAPAPLRAGLAHGSLARPADGRLRQEPPDRRARRPRPRAGRVRPRSRTQASRSAWSCARGRTSSPSTSAPATCPTSPPARSSSCAAARGIVSRSRRAWPTSRWDA